MTNQLSGEDLATQQELDRQFVEAMNRKDLEGLMSFFWDSPNLVMVGWDGTVHQGSERVREVMGRWFARADIVRLEVDEITHVPVGDGVMAVGTATYEIQPKDGPPQRVKERWTDLRRKVGDRWVLVMDHVHALPTAKP